MRVNKRHMKVERYHLKRYSISFVCSKMNAMLSKLFSLILKPSDFPGLSTPNPCRFSVQLHLWQEQWGAFWFFHQVCMLSQVAVLCHVLLGQCNTSNGTVGCTIHDVRGFEVHLTNSFARFLRSRYHWADFVHHPAEWSQLDGGRKKTAALQLFAQLPWCSRLNELMASLLFWVFATWLFCLGYSW